MNGRALLLTGPSERLTGTHAVQQYPYPKSGASLSSDWWRTTNSGRRLPSWETVRTIPALAKDLGMPDCCIHDKAPASLTRCPGLCHALKQERRRYP